MKVGRQIKIVSYYPPDRIAALDKLSVVTRVPKAEYLREALEDLLKKYRRRVKAPLKRARRIR